MSQPQLYDPPGQILEQPKPTLTEIREERWFGFPELARRAGVPTSVVVNMLERRPVTYALAYRVLVMLTHMHAWLYTCNEVDVVLEKEEQEQCQRRPKRPYRRRK